MKNIKEILKNVIHKNTTNADNAISVGASSARPPSKARPYKKTILITLPILFLLIAALIALGITNAANTTTEPETEQTFTEDGDGYYIWVRAVDHAGNKGPWSEAQRVWIETGLPTITIKTNSNTTWAKTGSVTVALQDSKSGLAAGASVKYGWSTSLDTAPDSYTDATLNYTAGTKEDVTFTASASGLTGKYYLWVVPTTLADTAGNTQTTTAKSTGQFYFDNKGPTAPTLTGGSTTYATSQKIKVSTASTDTGVGTVSYYEYYKASNSTAPTASTSGTKVTTSDNSVTFSSNIAGHYVYFRAVDGVGNAGAWSSAARVYVDVNSPTVQAKNSSVTITAGDSVEMSSYFTTSANGNAAISSTVYKIGSTSYTNTSSLAAGTYTVTCTVTKVGGKTASASMTLVVKAKSNLPSETTRLGTYGFDAYWEDESSFEWGMWVSFTVPNDVNVVLLRCCSAYWTWCDTCQSEVGSDDNGPEYYVSVTPGATYYWELYYTGKDSWYGVYYSSDINEKSPNLDHLH